MKIYDARYERTFKVADCESEKIALAAIVDEGEDAAAVLGDLKQMVNSQATRPQGNAAEKSSTVTMPKGAVAEKKPETVRTSSAEKKAEVAKTEVVKEAPKTDKVEKAEDKKAAAPKETKAKAPAITPYTRANDDHRGKLGTIIDGLLDGWRDIPPAKAAAQGLSHSYEGKPFIDAKGNFVPEFLAEVNKVMAPFLPNKDDI